MEPGHSVGVDYLLIFHPNNPPLGLGMLVGCVATDTSSSNYDYSYMFLSYNGSCHIFKESCKRILQDYCYMFLS